VSIVPKGWATTDFGSLLTHIVGGGTPSKSVPTFFEGDVPFMTVKDMTERFPRDTVDHISEEAIQNSATIVVPADTLIVATRMSLGKVVRPRFKTAINQDLKAIFLADGVDKTFVEHWWRYRSSFIQNLGTGTTVKGVRLKDISTLSINLAPLNEQKRIADKLDALLSRVDACRERLDRVPQILKHFRHAVLAAATSGALTEKWRKTNSLKRNWPRARLAEIGELGRGKSRHRPRNDPRLYGGTYPFIQTGDVAQSGGTIHAHTQTYSAFGLAQSKLWPAGTVCITIAANIADTAILSYPTCFPDSVVGFVANPLRCLPQFVKWWIDVIRTELEAFAPATAQKNINLAVLNNVELELPPLVEQREIVRRVENLFAFADRLKTRYTVARAQTDSMTPALLEKAFRGELVPQEPNDEPAEKLLERIKAAKSCEVIKPKRKALGRKPMTMKITTETVKTTIQQMPQDHFSFEELRNAFPGDYESLKNAVFALLNESETLSQFFDPVTQSMRLKRSQL